MYEVYNVQIYTDIWGDETDWVVIDEITDEEFVGCHPAMAEQVELQDNGTQLRRE